MKMSSLLLAATLLMGTALPTFSQDAHAGHGAISSTQDVASLTPELPEICLTAEEASTMEPMADNHEMDAAQADLMAGMDENNQLMMQAGMADDLDVAFVCAMIPHHQSAINMAKAELKHGDNPWAKEMAQKIIDAQESEIAEMIEWINNEGLAK